MARYLGTLITIKMDSMKCFEMKCSFVALTKVLFGFQHTDDDIFPLLKLETEKAFTRAIYLSHDAI